MLKCLKYTKQEDPEKNLEAAWKELEYISSGGELLLFVDNIDKSIEEDKGLQQLKTIPGVIVLISRKTSFGKEFEPYRIEFLDLKQCREIYESIRFEKDGRIQPEELTELEYIIEKLAGKHTITIEFLAYLARNKCWTVKDLKEKLEKKRFRLTFYQNGKLINIQNSFEVLYDLSELTDAEQNILQAFSVLPYIPLRVEVCNQWLFSDAGIKEEDDILVGLYQKGWLQFSLDLETYSMHPVFAQFIYEKYKPKWTMHHGLVEQCWKNLEISGNSSFLECQNYIPFAENILEKLDFGQDINQIKYINAVAFLLQNVAEYKKAEILYKRLLKIQRYVLREDHLDMAGGYSNLAGVYQKQGEYESAKKLFQKALDIRKKAIKGDNLDTARNYNNLAGVYVNQAKYREAEELYETSLQIRQRILEKNHPDIARSYNNLAYVYQCQKEYKKAEELYLECLKIFKSNLAEDSLEVMVGYNNLAYIFSLQKKYKRVMELYEKSLKICEVVYGKKHPEIARIYNNLGCVYVNQRNYEKAEELYEKSLQIYKEVFGEEHPYTVIIYNNQGEIYAKRKKYLTALDYFFKAYKVLVYKRGVSHPYTQIIYRNMKLVYGKLETTINLELWLETKMERDRFKRP